MTSLAFIKERRSMPFLQIGMRVGVDGNMGRVASGNRSGNINVIFNDTESFGKLLYS